MTTPVAYFLADARDFADAIAVNQKRIAEKAEALAGDGPFETLDVVTSAKNAATAHRLVKELCDIVRELEANDAPLDEFHGAVMSKSAGGSHE
jgi:hypothetical protein